MYGSKTLKNINIVLVEKVSPLPLPNYIGVLLAAVFFVSAALPKKEQKNDVWVPLSFFSGLLFFLLHLPFDDVKK